jgi:beta-phosphoglucomutase-like phosphatase (HAD superfamily)
MDRIRLTLSVTNLAPYFGDRVFNAAMVGRSKPAPDLFLFAAREMTTEPARALVVEDSVTGVAAGKAAGMTVWGFVGGSHANGDNSVEHLTDAGATRILRSMAEFSTR